MRSDDPDVLETVDVLDAAQGYAYADPEQRGFSLNPAASLLEHSTLLHDQD